MAKTQGILAASKSYEQWLAKQVPVVRADLNAKHTAMAEDPFSFLRATYYRWAQIAPHLCRRWSAAPRVMAVGDLHLENFGTWRDAEGRLVWGINDFDECGILPYTMDLVRLATSALIAIREDHLALTPGEACLSLWQGYMAGVQSGGTPFVLEEEHDWLRALATSKLRNAAAFWRKVESAVTVTAKTPADVFAVLHKVLPDAKMDLRVVHRQAGLGSLGRPRYTALGHWHGSKIAREAKAIVPNGADWARGVEGSQPENIHRMIKHPMRATDPMNCVHGHWVVRRLSPHCSRIELTDLPAVRDEEELLHAMGWETANMHLDGARTRDRIKTDALKRPSKWLLKSARIMSEATLADWKIWRKSRRN